MMERLIEPLGLLYGPDAAAAIEAGLALPLAGGPASFSLARLIEGDTGRLVPAGTIPVEWVPERVRVKAPPPLAGLPPGPLVMGILNVTPDSFSDGGRHLHAGDAIAAAHRMIRDGAHLIDIGGESTRPDAAVVPPDVEQQRILPVVRALAGAGALLSVDTRNAATMRAALQAGADIVNDVSGLTHDPDAIAVLAEASCPLVLMHMRGTPQTMAGLTGYRDVAIEMVRELDQRIEAAVRGGIARSRIVVDPGIGFAKTGPQNLELIRRLPILANLSCRVMLGVSRKGFIGKAGQAPSAAARLPGSLAAALPGLSLAHTILRVHDVAETLQAVRLWQAVHG